MQLPNKLYSYKESTLALVPVVLNEIKDGPFSVKELYERLKSDFNDPTDFMSVMDCLYALNAADINDNEEVFMCLSR